MHDMAEVRVLRPGGLTADDIAFRQKLFSVVRETAIDDQGYMTESPLLKAMLLWPLETELFAERLAMRFHTKEVGLVIGIDTDGAILANGVARILKRLYMEHRPVAFLSMRRDLGGSYAFSFPAPEVLRGANTIIIEPFLSSKRWLPIRDCLEVIEGMKLNTNVSAIGTVIQCDGPPVGMKNGFRIESLYRGEFPD